MYFQKTDVLNDLYNCVYFALKMMMLTLANLAAKEGLVLVKMHSFNKNKNIMTHGKLCSNKVRIDESSLWNQCHLYPVWVI